MRDIDRRRPPDVPAPTATQRMMKTQTSTTPAQPQARLPARAKAAPGRNGYRYRQQWGIVIVCRDAAHQAELYGQLRSAGHRRLRVVVV